MIYLLLVAAFCSHTLAVYEDVPRGVPPSRSAFYKRGKEFQCLDGSLRIPYEQVNDDYCDCPDGSDEPGTSACPEGRFYCPNRLHEPKMIPSSRVNDKICDCCDGSDEYDGGVECANICDELGKSAREEKARREAIHKAGWEKRKQLAVEGLVIKNDKLKNTEQLRADMELLQPEKDALEQKKKVAEEKETAARDSHDKAFQNARQAKKEAAAAALFSSFDSNNDGVVSAEELMAISYFDVNGDGAIEDNEIQTYLEEGAPIDLPHFTERIYNSVKQLKRDAEEREKRKREEAHQPDQADKDDAGNGVDENDDVVEEHGGEGEGVDLPPLPVDEDDLPYPAYSEETNSIFEEANSARDALRDVEKKISDIQNSINEVDAFSSLDFGDDFAWAPLKGKCVELDEGQYIYKICPFEKTSQKDKGGYSETNLGNWKEWKSKYGVQFFSGGQQCWNGPDRSTEVFVECGEETELVHASEPGRCEYKFILRSPAACEDPDKVVLQHQEL